jgi:hypothetical protein
VGQRARAFVAGQVDATRAFFASALRIRSLAERLSVR